MVMNIFIVLLNFFLILPAGKEPSLLESVGKLDDLADEVLRANEKVPLYSNLIEYNAIKQNYDEKTFVADVMQNNLSEQKTTNKKNVKLFFNLDDPLFDKKISFCFNDGSYRDLCYLIAKLTDCNVFIDDNIMLSSVGYLSFENMSARDILKKICLMHEPQIGVQYQNNTLFFELANKLNCRLTNERVAQYETKILDLFYVTIDLKLEKKLYEVWHNLIAGQEETFFTIDAENRLLIFKGPCEAVCQFEDYIAKIDKKIPQVRIDAIILLAQKAFNFDVGINWSGIYNKQNCLQRCPQDFQFVGVGGRLPDFPTPTKSDFPNNDCLLVNPLNFALNLFNRSLLLPSVNRNNKDIDASFIKIPFVFGGPDLNMERLNLVLNAAEHESKVKIISRPSILSKDGDTAHIVIGESLPLNTTIEDVVQTVVRNSSSIHYKDVGIVLKVTPKVTPKFDILLDLAIEEADVISGSTRTNSAGIMENPPVINFIRTHNKVVLKDKQTTVIGGLRGLKEQNSLNYVPLISKIPIVGWFFTAQFEYREDLERYIFITANLVD
jgi:hypothetical protein